jgi:hypothetical protein
MKKNLFLLIWIAGLGFMSCQSASQADDKSFGAGVSNPSAAEEFTAVMDKLNAEDSVMVIMKGKVTGVCQAKGCWMKLTDPSDASQEEMFVQFKDYGFFMPKDLAGHQVIVEGKAYKATTSVEELKHYAEDDNKSAEEIAQITSPLVEKKFMASGVVIVD